MALNIADLFEHAVDAVPDNPAVKVLDRIDHLRRARAGVQQAGPLPRLAGRRAGRPRRRLRQEQCRARRRRPGRGEDPGGQHQRQLPLRRGRAELPVRQRRREGPDLRAPLRADRGGLCAQARAADHLRGDPRRDRPRQRRRHLGVRRRHPGGGHRRPERRARLPGAQRRRPAHHLHRRHDRLPQGRDVAPRGLLARARRRHRLLHRRAAGGVRPVQAGRPTRGWSPSRSAR